MRNLAIKYLESWKDWGCMGQQGMADILVGFAELVVAQKTPTNSAMDAIRKAYIEGYSMGHHHTVEGEYWPEQAAEDWLSEQHQ